MKYEKNIKQENEYTTNPLLENNKNYGLIYDPEINNYKNIVDERNDEIIKIIKSIDKINSIFKELNALVIVQGSTLDNIEYNMEHAVGNAKKGETQLIKAEEHQKEVGCSFKIIIILSVLITLMVIVLILKHSI
jgi:syntaxin 16